MLAWCNSSWLLTILRSSACIILSNILKLSKNFLNYCIQFVQGSPHYPQSPAFRYSLSLALYLIFSRFFVHFQWLFHSHILYLLLSRWGCWLGFWPPNCIFKLIACWFKHSYSYLAWLSFRVSSHVFFKHNFSEVNKIPFSRSYFINKIISISDSLSFDYLPLR